MIYIKPCPFCGRELQRRDRLINPHARCVTPGCKGGQLPVLKLDDPADVAARHRRNPTVPASPPVSGTVYHHKNSGGPYIVERCLPIKLDGEWHENGVTIYGSQKTRKFYARLTHDFMQAFDRVRPPAQAGFIDGYKMETFSVESAICPYCGYENAPSDSEGLLYDESTAEYECHGCEKTFRVGVFTSYSWTCTDIDAA
ncbi:hypothetical protein [Thiocystis violacea]|uniref:hypothetical protein n=1 Tax=Thiocystis violacea TaxID=13725 RepID=UPI001904D7D3|nr:hypothetical protein [Thiocystis violacea]